MAQESVQPPMNPHDVPLSETLEKKEKLATPKDDEKVLERRSKEQEEALKMERRDETG